MCVGHISQKQAIIDGEIVPLIVKILKYGGSITQEEGVWAVEHDKMNNNPNIRINDMWYNSTAV